MLIYDGGSGSGNFGHGGRPGKIGGSTEEESTSTKKYGKDKIKDPKKLDALPLKVKDAYLSTIAHEEAITKDVAALNKKCGMTMVGERYSIKQPDSYGDKVKRYMEKNGWSEEKAIDSMHDTVRYTSTTSAKNLVSKTKKMLNNLKEEGYSIKEVKNTWLDDKNPYNGINAKVVSPDGVKMEMQFHTPQSFDMKERKMHKDYEEYRDPDTPKERKEELYNKMFDRITNNKKWNIPDNIDKI